MKIVIHDRTEQLPTRLRTYTEQKLGKLSRHFDRVLDAVVDFELERKRSQEPSAVVRIIVHMDGRNGPMLKAQESAVEMQGALDLALDKIDRQVVKLKEKIKERKLKAPGTGVASVDQDPELTPVPPQPDRVQVHLKAESPDQARDALDSNGHVFRMFLNEETGEVNVVYRRSDGSTVIVEPLVT